MNEQERKEAQEAVNAGKQALQYLYDAREKLVFPNLRMEISSFLSFADFFIDGLVADYLVQSKITEARWQVQDAIDYVTLLSKAL